MCIGKFKNRRCSLPISGIKSLIQLIAVWQMGLNLQKAVLRLKRRVLQDSQAMPLALVQPYEHQHKAGRVAVGVGPSYP